MRKQLLIGAIVLSLVITGGTYAISYTTATTAMEVDVAGTEIAIIEPAPDGDQPDWDSLVPYPEEETEYLEPDSAGDNTRIPFQEPDSGYHWDKVDDVSPDDWATYVYTDDKRYKRDLYNIQDSGWGSGEILGVLVRFRVSADEFNGEPKLSYAKAIIKTGGTVYEGDEETLSGRAFVNEHYLWESNPYTGEAWTWDDIDDLQIGVSLKRGEKHSKAYCTMVCALIYYLEEPETEGEVPSGDLFTVTPNENYTGDLTLKVYLTNTGDLVKAYKYLNMKLYLDESEEAGETPNYQLLTLDNGVATFHLKEYTPDTHLISITGGGYRLVSGDASEWENGWSIAPELYCEIY